MNYTLDTLPTPRPVSDSITRSDTYAAQQIDTGWGPASANLLHEGMIHALLYDNLGRPKNSVDRRYGDALAPGGPHARRETAAGRRTGGEHLRFHRSARDEFGVLMNYRASAATSCWSLLAAWPSMGMFAPGCASRRRDRHPVLARVAALFEQLAARKGGQPAYSWCGPRGLRLQFPAGGNGRLGLSQNRRRLRCSVLRHPLIKGRQRSKPQEEILREARELAEQQVHEIILIAQDTTAYGRDRGERDAPCRGCCERSLPP